MGETVRLETARKLKEAGIAPWYAVLFDNNVRVIYRNRVDAEHCEWVLDDGSNIVEVYRPDQLLAEIEKRGWKWSLHYPWDEYFILIGGREAGCLINETFRTNTSDEAAAQVLLWILEQE